MVSLNFNLEAALAQRAELEDMIRRTLQS